MELQFPLHNDTSRKIIHIDMDAFFASVEERDHPEFRGHPLVIARHPSDTGGRGEKVWYPFSDECAKSI